MTRIVIALLTMTFSISAWFLSSEDEQLKQHKVAASKTSPLVPEPTVIETPTRSYPGQYKLIVQLYKEAQYTKALELIKRELSGDHLSPSYRSWLTKEQRNLKIKIAYQFINSGQCYKAIPLLEEVIELEEHEAALKALGFCYYERSDFWSTSAYLERFLKKYWDPKLLELYLQAQESLGQYEDAILLLNHIKSNKTLNREDEVLLDKSQSVIESKLSESEHQIRLEGKYLALHFRGIHHENLGFEVISLFDQSVEEFAYLFDVPPLKKIVEVYLYKAQNFSSMHHGPSWAQGLYDGKIRIPVPLSETTMSDNLKRTIRHELAHAMLSQLNERGKLPTWFHEGLAQIFECPNLCNDFQFPASRGEFLSKNHFGKSFLQLNAANSHMSYLQSKYMLMIYLEQHGIFGLQRILSRIRNNVDYSSSRLFAGLNTSFLSLYQNSAKYWKSGHYPNIKKISQ